MAKKSKRSKKSSSSARTQQPKKSLYQKVKAPFLELERDLEKDERILLRTAKYFLVFCVFMIVSTLIYYSNTRDEMLPFFALGIVAAVFWTHSDKTGKIFMIAAASLGFIHEVIGGMEGWFVYTSGAVYQTPLWLIPGYAVMYWACYNLWKEGKKKYKIKDRNFNILALSLIGLSVLLDLTVAHFRPTFWQFDIVVAVIIIALFRQREERHLALVTWLLCAFNEFLGFSLGAWQHYLYPGQVSTLTGYVDITPAAGHVTGFSFIGITLPYIVFLWGSLKFVNYVQEKKAPLKAELVAIAGVLAIKTYTWLSSSILLAALLAGKLF